MNRRTRANFISTFAAQPWTLFEDDPAAGGGGGTGTQSPKLNEHGYPDATPVADMAPEQAAAYWKHQSRKHEARANAVAPDELKRLQDRDAALKAIEVEKLTADEKARLDIAAAATARAEAERLAQEATRRALVLEVAMDKGLTSAQAARLQGSTKEEMEADADELLALFVPAGTQPVGPRHVAGPPVNGASGKTVSAGEARYHAKFGTPTT
jgi:hypothetical protein